MFDPYGYWDDYDTYEDEPSCQSCLLRVKRQAIIKDNAGIIYAAWKGALVREDE